MTRLRVALIALALAGSIQASTTYISQTGPQSGNFTVEPSQILIVSWTQTVALSNVQISALLAASGGPPTGTAYLTNALGNGTTSAANLVAINNSAPFPAGSIPSFSVLFSGLTLPAATYYLIINGPGPGISDNNFWEGSSAPSITTVPGISYHGDYMIAGLPANIAASETQPGYLPSASFISNLGLGLQFVVSDSSPVPEPGSWALAALGLIALGVARTKFS
jgi:PEP-CTERM motif